MVLPQVRINALALRNLDSLPFKQLQASNGPAPPTLAARARWLEHGLGAAQALTSAATAALAESVPSALVSPVRYNVPRKHAGPPAIWIFGSDADIAQASELLGEAFSVTEHGVWTSHAPRAQTDALFDALSRAVTAALEADGSIRLGADILDPASQLSYRFKFVLSSGSISNVVLRVAVYQSNLRLVDADDTIAVLDQDDHAPLMPVVVAPLALRATLSRRKLAGDALSASVLARWKEAGLLPSRGLKDESVIFLRLQSGLEVPFPRACVLTSIKKESLLPEQISKPSGSVNNASLNTRRDQEFLWRSRKRPRSPSTQVEKREEQRIPGPDSVFNKSGLDGKPKFYSSNPVEQAASEIPLLSSCSFSAALKEAGMKDPTPVLHHPLARTPAPPPPLQDCGPTAKSTGNNMIDGMLQKTESGANDNTTFISEKPTPAPVDLTKTQTSDLEMFGFGQDVTSGFGAGNIDMNDVGSLDDDVGMFFGGGMDSCLLGGSSPFSSLGAPSANHSSLGGNEGNTIKNKKSITNLPNTGNSVKPVKNAPAFSTSSRKAAGNSLGIAEKGFDKRKCPKNSAEILSQVLSSIAAVPVSTQGLSSTDRDAELKSFYEEDFTKRVTESLNAGRLPTEIFGRAVVCPADTRYVPNYTKYGSAEGVRSLLNGAAEESKSKLKRPVYIPKRRLKLYHAMARKNMKSADILRKLSTFSANLESSSSDSEEESDSEDEEVEIMQKQPSTHSRVPSDAVSSEVGKSSHETTCSVYNSTRIAQNVAVDCASACMVLIEEFHRSTATSSAPCGSKTSPQSVVLPSNGPHSAGGIDVKSPGLPISVTAGTSPSAAMHAPSPKTPALSHSSHGRTYPNSKKKDKDTDAFLSLLQMQCIGVEGLQLFGSPLESPLFSEASVDVTDNRSGKKNTTNAISPSCVFETEHPKPVTTAVLRRVLYGFSRTIECSKALRSYAVDVSSSNCSGKLEVTGPLNLSDVYGNGSVIRELSTPQVCIGYNADWIETSGDVLPLWEKTGLEPYSERKDVKYVILAPKSSEECAKVFFRDVSAAYEECSYGTHTPMSGEHVTAIAIPRSSSKSKNSSEPYELTSDDSAMVQQYALTITGLSTKLASLRKTPNATTSNLVVYIVSPFSRGSHTANAALLRAVSPLLNSVPGACATANNALLNNPLPSSSWLSPSRNGNGLALHVRVIPHEAVDRRLSSWMKADLEIGVPPRPQLVKGLAFSVYSSLRSKRLRNNNMRYDKESAGNILGSTLSPDDQMSPMTPDLLTDPVALSMAPLSPAVSPHGSLFNEDNVAGNTLSQQGQSGGVAIDQSSALCPSYLHEPAVVLAGVGSQLGQVGGQDESCTMVLHLAYAFCKVALRYVFAWTDSRGEILDMASVPVVGSGSKATRRGAFWCMWLRGQRWRLPYVESTHVTITKLGNMMEGEVEDWDVVLSKVLYGSVSGKCEAGNVITRRFTNNDAYMDHPTPATPAARGEQNGTTTGPSTPGTSKQDGVLENGNGHGNNSNNGNSHAHGLKSITLCTMQDGNEERLLVEPQGEEERKNNMENNRNIQDFLCVADSTVYGEPHVQGKAVLGSTEGDGRVTAITINVMVHYGRENENRNNSNMEEEETRKRDVINIKWDGASAAEVARTVAENFHELRYVGSAPCWPQERWRNKLPLHAEMVRNYRHTLKRALSALQRRSNNNNNTTIGSSSSSTRT